MDASVLGPGSAADTPAGSAETPSSDLDHPSAPAAGSLLRPDDGLLGAWGGLEPDAAPASLGDDEADDDDDMAHLIALGRAQPGDDAKEPTARGTNSPLDGKRQ
jgi:hypothetical protein